MTKIKIVKRFENLDLEFGVCFEFRNSSLEFRSFVNS